MFSSVCLGFRLDSYSASFTRVPAPPSVSDKKTLFTIQTLQTHKSNVFFFFSEVNH